MHQDWQAGYREAVLNYVLAKGCPRYANADIYGWTRHDSLSERQEVHLKTCGLNVEESSLTEDASWFMFEDSFTDCSTHYGIDAGLSCVCGELKEVPYRLEETLGEVMRGLLGS